MQSTAPASGTQNPRWVRRPEGSTWGDFGPDDHLGRLNLLTAQKVREGLAEVRDCRTFSLSLPLDLPGGTALNPNRLPPVLRPTLRGGKASFNCELEATYPGSSDVVNDDLAVLHLQYSTQWDSLSHVGSLFDADGDGIPEPVYYNGFRAGTEVRGPATHADAGFDSLHERSTSNAGELGIGTMAEHPIQGRAVMIDLAAHLGEGHTVVGFETLKRIMEVDGIEVATGDILVLHTGYAEKVFSMGGDPNPDTLLHYGAALDGRDADLLQWITDSGVAAIAADNFAVELFPAYPAPAPSSVLPLHEHCLFKLGVPLGELWRLTPLANHLRATGRSRFLLTAAPLNLPGAAGSPLNPIATT